jgi:hypothetical protein
MDSDDEDSTDEADCCNGVIMDIEDDDELYTTADMSDSLINTISACIGKVMGCRIYGIENVAKYNPRLSKQKKAVTTLDDIEGSDSDSETEDILCKQCKRTFYSVANKEKHACKGLGSWHNIVNFSITYVYDKVQQHQLTVVQGDNDQSAIDILKALPIQGARCTFGMGWVNVPPQGKMYGKKYIAPFADAIIAMYLAGKNDKSKRTGPPGM